jgi:hypothetical protein
MSFDHRPILLLSSSICPSVFIEQKLSVWYTISVNSVYNIIKSMIITNQNCWYSMTFLITGQVNHSLLTILTLLFHISSEREEKLDMIQSEGFHAILDDVQVSLHISVVCWYETKFMNIKWASLHIFSIIIIIIISLESVNHSWNVAINVPDTILVTILTTTSKSLSTLEDQFVEIVYFLCFCGYIAYKTNWMEHVSE